MLIYLQSHLIILVFNKLNIYSIYSNKLLLTTHPPNILAGLNIST